MPARSRRAPAPPARHQVRGGRAGPGGPGAPCGARWGPPAVGSRQPGTPGKVGRDPEPSTRPRAPAVRCAA